MVEMRRAVYECGVTPTAIVSGDARGADTLARQYADEMGILYVAFIPDWKSHPNAGKIRNADIVDVADKVLAIWDGVSGGTADSIAKARIAHKLIRIHRFTKQSKLDHRPDQLCEFKIN